MKRATESLRPKATGAVAVLVPLASIAAGMNLGNHNETVTHDA